MSTETNTRISKRVEKELHQTKVVIRRLPPDFSAENFLETVNPLPSNSYFYFAPGDSTLGAHGCSRAYIAFNNEAEILPFRDQYDGLVLESGKGTKYRMTVEYAPFQNIPKKSRRKPDTRIGTIEEDADFISFLEAYEGTEEPTTSLDLVAYLQNLEATKRKAIQSTPLTEYLDKKGLLRRKGRNEAKKKHKGEASKGGKGRGVREDSKLSKTREESSRDTRRKERRQDKAPPKLVTKDKEDNEPTQWPTIEPTEIKTPARDPKYETKSNTSSDRHSKGEGRTKNRDRPDRGIYTPRSRDDSGKHKEDGGEQSTHQGRSQRYKGGKDEGQEERYSGRSTRGRGRGPRDRQKEYNDYRHES